MGYWLMKSEPNCFSIDDLQEMSSMTAHWDGVRNYQARNMLRDDIKKGDLVFFYHSNCDVPGIVGVMQVAKEGYPDFTAEDPESDHFDPKHTRDNPRWYMVDVKFKTRFERTISLAELKANPFFSEMQLLQKGNRLSVMPVRKSDWDAILTLLS
jgi:predicted RNA-binding protein with PUA-like domain